MVKKWLNNKTFLRILSLVIAFALWSYVIITQDPERTARIDNVEVICGLSQMQLNEGLTIISKSHETVSFTATGNRSLVTGSDGKFYAKLDLDNIMTPGKYSITPVISKPDSVTVQALNPTAIEVHIDRYVSSLIPVKVHTIGTLPEGIAIKSATPDISVTTVTVPSLMLEEISYVGATIDLSQVTSSGKIDVAPILYNENGNVLNIIGTSIEASVINVDIEAERTKTVPVYPIVSDDGGFAKGLKLNVSPQTIAIYGNADAVNAVTSVTTDSLKLFSVPSGNDEFHVKLQLPVGVRLADGASDTVTLTFK